MTAYDGDALRGVLDRHLDADSLARECITQLDRGSYELSFTATAGEVARTAPNPVLDPASRRSRGCR